MEVIVLNSRICEVNFSKENSIGNQREVNTGMLILKSIREINESGYHFFIPSYQRGYRWTQKEVKDLLTDIHDFNRENNKQIYCIQPLVVKKMEENKYEVIDGQQRLTTIFILLTYLDSPQYAIEYATREESRGFLENIANREDCENIDFYHMHQAYQTIKDWFKKKEGRDEFKEKLFDYVKFIWYEVEETEDAIEIFTRLNIGKIPLTDAELIKALFLNQSNFKNESENNIRRIQQEIATEWDTIEYTLQNDEFWLFLNQQGWKKLTRIDFIFDLIQARNGLELSDDKYKDIGIDEHKTFRYFYEYFKNSSIKSELLRETWLKIKFYFQVFNEWYNDLELYHYIGYLIDQKVSLEAIFTQWNGSKVKDAFKNDYLVKEIKGTLKNCNDLTKEYEVQGSPKTQCRPLLLLFNIQTVINQNKALISANKYGLGTFYKYPFHLYKKEGKKANGKGWEIEHIASYAGDDLEKFESQKIYLAAVKYALQDKSIKDKITQFIESDGEKDTFDEICNELKELENKYNSISDEKKNFIWNFALLDSTTNEEYQNSPFPIKRICVLAKDRGQKATLTVDDKNELKIEYEEGIAFVPPCTRNIFTKAYTEIPTALNAWTLEDAKMYLKEMNKVLSDARFIENQTESIKKFYEKNEVKNG